MKLPFNISKKVATRGAIVLVVLLVAYYASRKFGGWLSAQDRSDSNLSVDTNNLTISENQAEVFADRLQTAMDGDGTDGQTVIDTLSVLQTPDDFSLLVKTFGRRKNCAYLGLSCETGNLIDWFQQDFYGFGNNWLIGGVPAVYWQTQLESELKRLGFSFDN